jgi:hypothetical protein
MIEAVAYMVIAPGHFARPVLTEAEVQELMALHPGAIVKPLTYVETVCTMMAAIVNKAFDRR